MANRLSLISLALCAAAGFGANVSAQTWRATTHNEYFWMEEKWNQAGTTAYAYYPDGAVKSSTTSFDKTEYTYDELGRLICKISLFGWEGEFTNSSKSEYSYDPKVESFVVKEESYSWNNGEWVLSSGRRTDITRRDDGKITSLEVFTLNTYVSQNWEPSGDKVTITYGDDNRASAITVARSNGSEAKVTMQLEDIVWDRTDGQMTDFDLTAGGLLSGANRILTATATVYTDATGDVDVTATYPDDKGSYSYKASNSAAVYNSGEYTVIDALGSFSKKEAALSFDYDEASGAYTPGDIITEENAIEYDSFGLEIAKTKKTLRGDYAVLDTRSEATVTYDPERGYPTEYILRESYYGEELQNTKKIVYSDYIDTTAAISAIGADDCDAPVEFYDLRGRRMPDCALPAGIYIRRQGSSATKVAVR